MATAQLSLAEQLAELPEAERLALLADMPDEECEALLHDWSFWARPEQLLPETDDWDVLMLLGGRGAGKTRPSAEIIHKWAENQKWHFALVGETAAEVRDVMVEGTSGLLSTMKPWNPCIYEPSKRRIVWPKTGSWATTFSGDSPDQLRGPNCHGGWCDELAKFRYPADTWNNLEMVLRAGNHPRVVVSTTPRPIKAITDLMPASGTVLRRYSTYSNIANLAPSFIRRILDRYEGTRLGRQELHAEILSDTPGALWNRSLLDETRVTKIPELVRIVIAVDPPGGTITECGLVVCGLGSDGHGYIIADESLAGTPATWGGQAVALYSKFQADRIVAETNHGGDMVIYTIETAAKNAEIKVATKKLHASRGKYARAEPASALFEQGRCHMVGSFGPLEDELCTWVPNEGLPSPNRLDSMVWGITELMLEKQEVKRAGTWGRR